MRNLRKIGQRPIKRKAYANGVLVYFNTTLITNDQWDFVYNVSERDDRTVSSIVREALDLFIAKHKKDLDKSQEER